MTKVGDKFILVSEEPSGTFSHYEVVIQRHKTNGNPTDETINDLIEEFENNYGELDNDEVYILTVEKVLKKQSRWAEEEQ